MSDQKIADKRLFFNADKTKFVDEFSTEARSLAAAVGDPIPDVEKPDAVEAKEAEPAENKQADTPANKGGVKVIKKS